MQISLTFDPKADDHKHVSSVVNAVFGVPNAPGASTGLNMPVSTALTPSGALPTGAASTVNASPVVATGASSPLVGQAPLNALQVPDNSTGATNLGGANAGAIQLDKDGVPWDARIHSGGTDPVTGAHKINANGCWAKRKGGTPLDHATITKELQTLMANQVGHAAPPAGLPVGGVLGNPTNVPHQEAVAVPGNPDAFVAQPIGGVAPMPAVAAPMVMPTIAPMPTVDASGIVTPAPAPIPAAPNDYVSLAQWVAQNMAPAGKLTPEHIEHFCRTANVVNAEGKGDFGLVQHQPQLIKWLYDAFVAQIAVM